MRVLLFCSSYAPRAGGLETVTRQLARELAGSGHEVSVATNRYPRTFLSQEHIDGVPVFRQLYPAILPGARRPTLRSRALRLVLLPLAPVALLRLTLLVRRLQPDIMNIHYVSYPALYALIAARLLRVPAVLSCHGSDVVGKHISRLDRWVVRAAAHASSSITVCSEYLAEELSRLLGPAEAATIVVARNGVELPPADSATLPIAGPYMFLNARLEHVKGIDVVIQALALLRERGVTPQLVIAGGGSEQQCLERLARCLCLERQVTLLGQVDRSAVRALLEAALFAVVPSRREALGMSCLEAMLAGKAVIATDVGGLREIAGESEAVLLVPPDDPVALSGAMAQLLAHADDAAARGECGRMRAETEFGWKPALDAYLRAYDAALRTRRPRVTGSGMNRLLGVATPSSSRVVSVLGAPSGSGSPARSPSITVLICTVDRPQMLDRALRSLREGTELPEQVVVVNGGGDAANRVVREHADVFPAVVLLQYPNRTLAASRNLGLPHCTGDIVAMTDDDAEVASDWVASIRVAFAANERLGAVGGPVDGRRNDRFLSRVADCVVFPRAAVRGPAHNLPGVNVAYRREALTAVGLFDEALFRGEDVDFNERVRRAGFEVIFDPGIRVTHEHRPTLRGLLGQQFMYGRAYVHVRARWPEMYCVYPRQLRSMRDWLKLTHCGAAVLYGPMLAARSMPSTVGAIGAYPVLVLHHAVWKLGMLHEALR